MADRIAEHGLRGARAQPLLPRGPRAGLPAARPQGRRRPPPRSSTPVRPLIGELTAERRGRRRRRLPRHAVRDARDRPGRDHRLLHGRPRRLAHRRSRTRTASRRWRASTAAGSLTDDPESPHRSAPSFDAELLLRHADQDHSMTAEQIERARAGARRAGLHVPLRALRRRRYTATRCPTRPSTTRPRPSATSPSSSRCSIGRSRRRPPRPGRRRCRRPARRRRRTSGSTSAPAAARRRPHGEGEVVPVARAVLRAPRREAGQRVDERPALGRQLVARGGPAGASTAPPR